MNPTTKTVNTWITPTGAIHQQKESTAMTTSKNRRTTDMAGNPPDFTETDLAALHEPNTPQIRSIHKNLRKFQHTMKRQTFKHYLSAIAFIRENDIIDPEVTRIAVNCGEWEVIWPDIGDLS